MSARAGFDCPLLPLYPLPRFTEAMQGCGGVIKDQLEDFVVEEIPAYLPCGEGEHTYLWLQKRDLSGGMLRRVLARSLGVADRDIGMAGLKDRRAVTRQWVSIPARFEPELERLEDSRIEVLQRDRHTNKLRTGHLKGNRFEVRIRGVLPGAGATVEAKLRQLQSSGMPNFYGSQRMGIGGSTLAAGWALANGCSRSATVTMPDGTTHRVNLRDRQLRRLSASALQSEVFNRLLARRMAEGLLGQVLEGDLCRKRDTGGMFTTDDAERDQQRMAAGELGVTGPMWGPKMRRPIGEARAWEEQALADLGLSEAHFAAMGSHAAGTRRMLRAWPVDVSVVEEPGAVVARFSLPAGSFATVLVHELSGPAAVPSAVQEAACA